MQQEYQEPSKTLVQKQIQKVQMQKSLKLLQNVKPQVLTVSYFDKNQSSMSEEQKIFVMKKMILKKVLAFLSIHFTKNSNDIGIFNKTFIEDKQSQMDINFDIKFSKAHIQAKNKVTFSFYQLETIYGKLKQLQKVSVSYIQQISDKLFQQCYPQVQLLIKYTRQLERFIFNSRLNTNIISNENKFVQNNYSTNSFDQFTRVATCGASSLFCQSLFQSQIGKICFLQNNFYQGISILQKSLKKTINFIQDFSKHFGREIKLIKPQNQFNSIQKQTDLNQNLFNTYKKNVRRTYDRYDSMYGYFYFEDLNRILKFQHLDHVILVALNYYQFSLKHYLLQIASFDMYETPSISLFRKNLNIMELLLQKSKQFVQVLEHYLKFINLECMTGRLQYSLSRNIDYQIKLTEYFQFLSLKIKNKRLDRECPLKEQVNPIFVAKFYCIGLILIQNQDIKQAIKYFEKAQQMQTVCFGEKSDISLKILKKIVSTYRSINQTKKLQFYQEKINEIINPSKTQEEKMMELNTLETQKKIQLEERFEAKKSKYPKSANLFQKKLFLEMDQSILKQIQGQNKDQVQNHPKVTQNKEFEQYEMDEQQ